MDEKVSKWSLFVAVIFILFAIISIITAFISECSVMTIINIATTFATLAGAILVFATLYVQRNALKEEINKNKFSRFDSRFYPILSSFRTDAANMECLLDCIKEKGREAGFEAQSSFLGDKAFYMYRHILDFLVDKIRTENYVSYDAEDIRITMGEFNQMETNLADNYAADEDVEKLDKKRKDYLHSQQGGFLLYKYGITEDIWQQYKEVDDNVLITYLFKTLIDYQPTILSKYIQTLRFILHIIKELPDETNQRNYYLHIASLLGKDELLFLRCFKEFDVITQ